MYGVPSIDHTFLPRIFVYVWRAEILSAYLCARCGEKRGVERGGKDGVRGWGLVVETG